MALYKSGIERQNLLCGMAVWAYAFQETRQKDSMSLNQMPVKGRISYTDCEMDGCFAPGRTGRFFVPFRKNSETEYAWSKAIKLSSRYFADTKEEATEDYNRVIDKNIKWYQEKIRELEGTKI